MERMINDKTKLTIRHLNERLKLTLQLHKAYKKAVTKTRVRIWRLNKAIDAIRELDK